MSLSSDCTTSLSASSSSESKLYRSAIRSFGASFGLNGILRSNINLPPRPIRLRNDGMLVFKSSSDGDAYRKGVGTGLLEASTSAIISLGGESSDTDAGGVGRYSVVGIACLKSELDTKLFGETGVSGALVLSTNPSFHRMCFWTFCSISRSIVFCLSACTSSSKRRSSPGPPRLIGRRSCCCKAC